MSSISMKELLEAGVHFGHQTKRWNPKMKRYIYGARNGIYIVDLHQTLKLFDEAQKFVQEVVQADGRILFVGTKKQAQDAIAEAAIRCRQYYVNQRWLGGMLTNFRTMRDRVKRLVELNEMETNGVLARLTKKEALLLIEERDKLVRYLGGVQEMTKLPDCLVIVDLKKEKLAVQEARRLDIPIVALVDTNCDPDDADYVIPGNDDAIRAVKLIASKIADAIAEIKQSEWEAEEGAEPILDSEFGEGLEKPDVDAADAAEIMGLTATEGATVEAASTSTEVAPTEMVAPVSEMISEGAPVAETAPEAVPVQAVAEVTPEVAPVATMEAIPAPAELVAPVAEAQAATETAPAVEENPADTIVKPGEVDEYSRMGTN